MPDSSMQPKLYYSIKEVAEFVGEEPSTLRYWETEFRELAPRRSGGGRRQYTSADIETIRIIRYLLRTKGMHISLAKEQLRTNRKNLSTKTSALEELTAVKASLEHLLSSLSLRK